MNGRMPARNWLIAGFAVAGLQTLVLGHMVWDRIDLLRHGREIVLPVVPTDPRAPFRGHDVMLSYDAQRVPVSLIGDDLDAARPATFYVTLAKTGDTWKPTALSAWPAPAAGDRINLKARTAYGYRPLRMPAGVPAAMPKPALQVRYGIESYFLPEDQGRALERLAREHSLAALIAVGADGVAAIKGLLVDGELQYEEPLL